VSKSSDKHKINILLKKINSLLAKKSKSSLSETLAEYVEKEEKEIGVEEKEILINAVNFTDTLAEDVMVPRSDIIAAPINLKIEAIKKLFIDTSYTRIPLYQDNLDNIKGFIHIKDILPYYLSSEKLIIEKKIRKALFIPPAMKIVDLAYKMRNEHTRLAIVVDEYGGTDGLITMEDLMDEIVGEAENNEIISLDNKKYEMSARVKIEDIEERLKIRLIDKSDIDDDFDTLGGLIASIAQRIPKSGETIIHTKNIKFYIKEAATRYIKKVIIDLSEYK
jgi:magnesium and cobalt transporter